MIKILKYTELPLTTIGEISGICYGATNPKRYQNIAKRCFEEGHLRVSEYADVIIEISDVSAKVVREIYTSTIGVSKLQSSTRYIDYSECFDFVTPYTIDTDDKKVIWNETMKNISKAMNELKELGVPTEDFTNLLPLAYKTKTVLKINIRALMNMMNTRLCTCAYWEYIEIMKELKKKISELDEEWKFISDNYFIPKCIKNGYCDEKTRHCGIRPLKSEVLGEN